MYCDVNLIWQVFAHPSLSRHYSYDNDISPRGVRNFYRITVPITNDNDSDKDNRSNGQQKALVRVMLCQPRKRGRRDVYFFRDISVSVFEVMDTCTNSTRAHSSRSSTTNCSSSVGEKNNTRNGNDDTRNDNDNTRNDNDNNVSFRLDASRLRALPGQLSGINSLCYWEG